MTFHAKQEPPVGCCIALEKQQPGHGEDVPPEIVFADWASNHPSVVSPLIVTSTTFTTISTFVPSRHPSASASSTKTGRSSAPPFAFSIDREVPRCPSPPSVGFKQFGSHPELIPSLDSAHAA
jgi:hypothetical protein